MCACVRVSSVYVQRFLLLCGPCTGRTCDGIYISASLFASPTSAEKYPQRSGRQHYHESVGLLDTCIVHSHKALAMYYVSSVTALVKHKHTHRHQIKHTAFTYICRKCARSLAYSVCNNNAHICTGTRAGGRARTRGKHGNFSGQQRIADFVSRFPSSFCCVYSIHFACIHRRKRARTHRARICCSSQCEWQQQQRAVYATPHNRLPPKAPFKQLRAVHEI